MMDMLQSNPLAVVLALSLGVNAVLMLAVTALAFMMRGQTPPEVLFEVAELIPVDVMRAELERYEKMARKNDDTLKEALAYLGQGGLRTLEAMQDSLLPEEDPDLRSVFGGRTPPTGS